MGLALMVVIWLITLASTYFFVAKTWWLPVGASAATGFIDGQLALTFVLMGIVFVAAQLSLGYLAWRYREQPSSPPVDYSHGNVKLEVVWTALTTVLFVGLNLMGSSVWASQRLRVRAGSGRSHRHAVCLVLPLSRTGWALRRDQCQADGSVQDGGEAAVGLNTSDPAAKDDVVTGTMYLPVDREVDLSLRSVDVIHSFFVPNLRFKQDAVPGLNIHIPDADGDWRIRNSLRRIMRTRSLQDARHGTRRQPGRFRQVAGGTGGGETINGDLGYSSRARGPSGLHSEIYFQPRSQSHWHSVLLSGNHGGICGDVPVAADAHPLVLAERAVLPLIGEIKPEQCTSACSPCTAPSWSSLC